MNPPPPRTSAVLDRRRGADLPGREAPAARSIASSLTTLPIGRWILTWWWHGQRRRPAGAATAALRRAMGYACAMRSALPALAAALVMGLAAASIASGAAGGGAGPGGGSAQPHRHGHDADHRHAHRDHGGHRDHADRAGPRRPPGPRPATGTTPSPPSRAPTAKANRVARRQPQPRDAPGWPLQRRLRGRPHRQPDPVLQERQHEPPAGLGGEAVHHAPRPCKCWPPPSRPSLPLP